MIKRLRFKYVQKKFFIWQDLEFLRNVRSNAIIYEHLFDAKKITKIEQEEWFKTFYSNKQDYHIYIIYHEMKKCPIGYVTLEIDNIKHRRIRFDYVISPEFNYIKCDKSILNWIVNKSGIIELDAMNKLWCYVLSGNDKRIEILAENGFEFDCYLRQHIYKNGKYHGVSIVSKIL